MFRPVCVVVHLLFLCMLCCAVNKNGDTAIHKAVYWGKLDIVKYLIQHAAVEVDVRGMVS